jgi:calcineurin-like phosphoesterase family protein
MAFRTFRNAPLSLWQSTVAAVRQRVRGGEPSTQDQDEFERATADYAETSYALTRSRWRLPSLERVFARLTRRDGPAPGGMSAQRLDVQSAIAHHLSMAEAAGDGPLALRIIRRFRPFEEGQPAWLACIAEHQAYISRASQVVYRSPVFDDDLQPDFSIIDGVIPSVATIGLVGDWGTGEPEAKNVMRALVGMGPDVIIHLGDIYYSGTPRECAQRFRKVIRSDAGFTGPVYALAGNHDYFSGGEGFHQMIDVLNSPAQRQPASYFNLRNTDWQLLAADTGHNDAVPSALMSTIPTAPMHKRPLRDDETKWHRHQLKNADGRRTIVLSHHQFGSLAAKIGKPKGGASFNPALSTLFGPYFESTAGSPGVAAWLWGHEHDLVELERPYQHLPLGVCIGHGAIPVNTTHRPKAVHPGGAAPPALRALSSDREGYLNRGFAVLYLEFKSARIEHYQVDSAGRHSLLGDQKL